MIFSKVIRFEYESYWTLYKLGTTSNRVNIKFYIISYWYKKVVLGYLAVDADARLTALRRSKGCIAALVSSKR